MKKSPAPLIVGWLTAAGIGAVWILILTFFLDRLNKSPRIKDISDILPGIVFWYVGVAAAMLPGVFIGAIVFYYTNHGRSNYGWLKAGFTGLLIIWAWSIPFGFGHRFVEGYQVALFLGSGAFLAASAFWYVTIKLEKPKVKGLAEARHESSD